jgi:serine/threonine protein kinase
MSTAGRGTNGYRAPEMIQDDIEFTFKVDIWAFGCIFFEVVSGRKAYKDDFEARESKWYELEIPNIDFHIGNSKQVYTKLIRYTLNPKPNERASATKLLGGVEELVDIIQRPSKKGNASNSESRSKVLPRNSTIKAPPNFAPIPLEIPAVPLTPSPEIASPPNFQTPLWPTPDIPIAETSPRGGYPTPGNSPVSPSSRHWSNSAIPLPEPPELPEIGQMYPAVYQYPGNP